MSVLIKDMEMPKDCPMCPMSHWDVGDNFRGCEIVPGKKHAIRDPEYANSNHRPNWCPLVPVPPHGDLIDRDVLEQDAQKRLLICNKNNDQFQKPYEGMRAIALAPAIIEAEEDE